jgi:hypothetical protein
MFGSHFLCKPECCYRCAVAATIKNDSPLTFRQSRFQFGCKKVVERITIYNCYVTALLFTELPFAADVF